jgi:TRAP-type transport system large permease protein
VVLVLLIFGCFMDIIAILIILAPVLGPVVTAIGVHPVHAGIIFILALNISLMTPPVGLSLFTLSSVTGEKVDSIVKEVWPFIVADLVLLAIVMYWPAFALLIPRLFGML